MVNHQKNGLSFLRVSACFPRLSLRPVSTQRDIPRHPVPPLKDTLTRFVRLYCIIMCFINSLTDCVVSPSVSTHWVQCDYSLKVCHIQTNYHIFRPITCAFSIQKGSEIVKNEHARYTLESFPTDNARVICTKKGIGKYGIMY